MNPMPFRYAEWGTRKPEEVEKSECGALLVSRNVRAVERDGSTVYVGELAIMTVEGYSAYVGAQAVAAKREQEIQDETVLKLIEEGSL